MKKTTLETDLVVSQIKENKQAVTMLKLYKLADMSKQFLTSMIQKYINDSLQTVSQSSLDFKVQLLFFARVDWDYVIEKLCEKTLK